MERPKRMSRREFLKVAAGAVIAAAALGGGNAEASGSIRAEDPEMGEGENGKYTGEYQPIHTVGPYDDLSGIAERWFISAEAIREANGLSENDVPLVGSQLTIPLPDVYQHDVIAGSDCERFFQEVFTENGPWNFEEQATVALILNRPQAPTWEQVVAANRLLQEKGFKARFYPRHTSRNEIDQRLDQILAGE